MSKTFVMTLRLPKALGLDLERFASPHGLKPAQLGARLVEEGLRRRKHPLIDLRETSAGRVAYVAGSRFAVQWVARRIAAGASAEAFAREYELPVAQVRAALAYAEAFPDEIEADMDRARDNLEWVRQQDAAWRTGQRPQSRSGAKTKASGKAQP